MPENSPEALSLGVACSETGSGNLVFSNVPLLLPMKRYASTKHPNFLASP